MHRRLHEMTSFPRLAYVNIFSADPEALAEFYMEVFGFREIESHRSPIYRCIDAGGLELGFNAETAYPLLNLASRQPEGIADVRTCVTLEVGSPEAVDAAVEAALAAGGRTIKPAYNTYYNARQAVMEDPEANVFRINHRKGPRIPADLVESPPWAKS
jgi:uncharacterized glyoxalase superfamily protein PhnB